jgi:hypothetical protein
MKNFSGMKDLESNLQSILQPDYTSAGVAPVSSSSAGAAINNNTQALVHFINKIPKKI